MVVLADNDILMKLAAFRLLEAAIAVLERHFEVQPSDIYVLDSLKGQLVKAIAGKHKEFRKFGTETCQHASDVLAQLPSLAAPPPDLDEVAQLEHPNIQAGEVVLFSATRDFEKFCLITGDKRSLRALAQLNRKRVAAQPIYNRIRGRVFCFEQVILLLIEYHGFELVKDAVVLNLEQDKMLKVAFSEKELSRQDAVERVLNMYIADLINGDSNDEGIDSVGVGTNWLWMPKK